MKFSGLLTLPVFLLIGIYARAGHSSTLDSLLEVMQQKEHHDTSSVALMNRISGEYIVIPKNDSAVLWSDKALKLSIDLGYRKGEALSLYQKGRAYLWLDDYLKASETLLQAQSIFKKLGDKKGIADCFMQIGIFNYTQKNYNEALKNFEEAMPLHNEAKAMTQFTTVQYLIGLTKFELGDYKSSLSTLLEALGNTVQLNMIQRSFECRKGIADVYYKTGYHEDALIYYRLCYDHYIKSGNEEGQLTCLIGIGNVMHAMKEDKMAEENYLKALEISKRINRAWRLSQAYEPLVNLYEERGNFQKAFQYQKLFHEAKDSLFNEQNMQAMASMKSKLDIASKQAEIDVMSQREKMEKKLRWSLLIIASLLIGLLVGLWRRFLLKKVLNSELEKKNKELDDTLRHLNATQQQLIKSEKMAVFGKLSAGVAHEIRNPLNFITNFSELSEQIVDDFIHSENENEKHEMSLQLKKLVDKIGYHGRRADSIVTRMLQHSRSAHTDAELTDINKMCEEFSELAYQSMRNLITNFDCHLEKKLDPTVPKIWLVPQDLSRVIINLLNNAFYAVRDKKHLHLNGYVPTVTIETTHNSLNASIRIQDNGAGIPEDVKSKIFDPFFTTKPMGEGTGLGLSICADIIKAARGEIKMESSEGNGTLFEVIFPIEVN